METNEAEVLTKAYSAAMTGDGSHWSALIAVAVKARELDAARGGTRRAEDVARHVAKVRACGAEVSCGVLSGHLAAQGRTIAAKDVRIAELRAMLASTESTLATLRQAVDDAVRAIIRGEFGRAETILNATKDATTAEHPDTATLRAIRERAKNTDALWDAFRIGRTDADGVHEVVRHLLGDSSPNGGGEDFVETDPEQPRPGEPSYEPTTPPDVAASEGSLFDACVDGSCEHSHAGTPSHIAWGRKMAALPENRPLSTGAVATTPTPEEDLRTVEKGLQHSKTCVQSLANAPSNRPCTCGVSAAREALARLKDAPRRAAERMRERCAAMCESEAAVYRRGGNYAEDNVMRGAAKVIRAFEVTP